MGFTGIFNTSDIPQDLAKKSFAGMITRLMPNGSAPLFGLSSMLESETAVQTEHGFFTKTMIFPSMTANGSQASTVTNLTVDTTANILPGMVMRNERTLEMIIINAVLNGTQATVVRGVGSVAAAAINDNDNFYQVGTAFEESSFRPQANNIQPVRITNYTQIFRNTWAVSDTVRSTMMIAGDTNVAESKQDCAAFHAADIEKAIFFGQKSTGTRNGQPFRTMDGHYNIVANTAYYPPIYGGVANINTAGSTTNYTQLQGFLDPCFNQTTDPKGANERVLFVGGTAHNVLNNIGRLNGTYFIADGQTSWGLQFGTLKLPRGTFRIIEHPLFNSNADWTKYAVAVDLASFRVAYLGDRKTQHKAFNEDNEEANDNGIDAVGGTLTTEMTIVVKNPPANAYVTNLTAAAQG